MRAHTSGSITDSVSLSAKIKAQSYAQTVERLVGVKTREDANTVRLSPVGMAVASDVYHPINPLNVMEANQFMASNLQLAKEQDTILNSDLKQENFLQDYEKLPQFQPHYMFKRRQQAAAITLRGAEVPLLQLTDKLADHEQELEAAVV